MNTAEQNIMYTGPVATRMAWTFGPSKLPVLCTVLGDEPLFVYEQSAPTAEGDVDEQLLDDIMLALDLDDALLNFDDADDKDFSAAMAHMSRVERAGAHLDSYAVPAIETAFDAFAAELSGTKTSDADFATMLADTLAGSHTLRAMHETIAQKGIVIAQSAQVDGVEYDRKARKIVFGDVIARSSFPAMLSKTLRQAFLHVQGALIDPLHFLPEDAVLINRLYAADEAVTQIQTAWELNLSGRRDAWLRVLGSGSYDLAIGFAREAVADFRSLDSGRAAQAVVDAWFFSGRCRTLDQSLIRDLLARDTAADFIADGQLKSLGRELAAKIGVRAKGVNYLSSMVEQLLNDPLYTDVRDRSSANFLWFMKFERQFRAHEESLSQAASANAAKIISFPIEQGHSQGSRLTLKSESTVHYL